jgi:hypothetical protein
MKKKELKNLAKKIAKYEKFIQSSTDEKEVSKARLKILQLSEEVTELDDFFQLDILISEILEKNS